MPRSCCVPGCKSNYYKAEVSTFRFPIDEARKSQWIKAINRTDFSPTKQSAVCIKHFDEKFVKLEDSCKRPDGTFLTFKRTRPALTKDAFPSIFSSPVESLSTDLVKRRTRAALSKAPLPEASRPIAPLPIEKPTQNIEALSEINPLYIREKAFKSKTKNDTTSDPTMALTDEIYIKEEILEVELEELDAASHQRNGKRTLLKNQETKHKELDAPSNQRKGCITPLEVLEMDPLEESEGFLSKSCKDAEAIQNKGQTTVSEEQPSQYNEIAGEFQDNHRLESEEPAYHCCESSDIARSKNQSLDSEHPPSHCSENSDKNKEHNLYYLILTPLNTKELICPTCTMKFKNQCSLDQHLKDCKGSKKRRRRGPMKKVCTTCGRIFKTWSHFYSHQIRHSEERPYSCDTCEHSFKRKADLDDHRALHSEEKPFLCSICALSFKRKRNLIQHERTHSKTRKIRQSQPHLCSTCGMIFKFKSSLEKHVVCHSEERPHLCETCGFSFKRKRDLVLHLHTHSEERPFSCNICGLSFKVKKYLISHERTHFKESIVTSTKENLGES